MKITNYQKQTLKMLLINFSSTTTFEEAQSLIEKAEKERISRNEFFRKNNNMEGSDWFSRWTEDMPRSIKVQKKPK
jgi:hypothetical protein